MDSCDFLTILQKQKIKRSYNSFIKTKNPHSLKICKEDLLNSTIKFINNLYFLKMYYQLYNNKKMKLNNQNKQIINLG